MVSGMKNDDHRAQDSQHHVPPEPVRQSTNVIEALDSLAQWIQQHCQHHQTADQTKVIAKIKKLCAWLEKRLWIQQKIPGKRYCPYEADEEHPAHFYRCRLGLHFFLRFAARASEQFYRT